MTGEQVIDKVKGLSLPDGSYAVFGSCPLALAGLRECADIDMLVTREVYDSFKSDGWRVVEKGPRDNPIVKDDFEMHYSWSFSSHNPSLSELLERATVVEGVPFAALSDVRKWKEASGRPKDLEDVELIDRYEKK